MQKRVGKFIFLGAILLVLIIFISLFLVPASAAAKPKISLSAALPQGSASMGSFKPQISTPPEKGEIPVVGFLLRKVSDGYANIYAKPIEVQTFVTPQCTSCIANFAVENNLPIDPVKLSQNPGLVRSLMNDKEAKVSVAMKIDSGSVPKSSVDYGLKKYIHDTLVEAKISDEDRAKFEEGAAKALDKMGNQGYIIIKPDEKGENSLATFYSADSKGNLAEIPGTQQVVPLSYGNQIMDASLQSQTSKNSANTKLFQEVVQKAIAKNLPEISDAAQKIVEAKVKAKENTQVAQNPPATPERQRTTPDTPVEPPSTNTPPVTVTAPPTPPAETPEAKAAKEKALQASASTTPSQSSEEATIEAARAEENAKLQQAREDAINSLNQANSKVKEANDKVQKTYQTYKNAQTDQEKANALTEFKKAQDEFNKVSTEFENANKAVEEVKSGILPNTPNNPSGEGENPQQGSITQVAQNPPATPERQRTTPDTPTPTPQPVTVTAPPTSPTSRQQLQEQLNSLAASKAATREKLATLDPNDPKYKEAENEYNNLLAQEGNLQNQLDKTPAQAAPEQTWKFLSPSSWPVWGWFKSSPSTNTPPVTVTAPSATQPAVKIPAGTTQISKAEYANTILPQVDTKKDTPHHLDDGSVLIAHYDELGTFLAYEDKFGNYFVPSSSPQPPAKPAETASTPEPAPTQDVTQIPIWEELGYNSEEEYNNDLYGSKTMPPVEPPSTNTPPVTVTAPTPSTFNPIKVVPKTTPVPTLDPETQKKIDEIERLKKLQSPPTPQPVAVTAPPAQTEKEIKDQIAALDPKIKAASEKINKVDSEKDEEAYKKSWDEYNNLYNQRKELSAKLEKLQSPQPPAKPAVSSPQPPAKPAETPPAENPALLKPMPTPLNQPDAQEKLPENLQPGETLISQVKDPKTGKVTAEVTTKDDNGETSTNVYYRDSDGKIRLRKGDTSSSNDPIVGPDEPYLTLVEDQLVNKGANARPPRVFIPAGEDNTPYTSPVSPLKEKPTTPALEPPTPTPAEETNTEKGTIVTGPNGEKTWVSGNDLPTGWESKNPASVYIRELDTGHVYSPEDGLYAGLVEKDSTGKLKFAPRAENGDYVKTSPQEQKKNSYYQNPESGEWYLQQGNKQSSTDPVVEDNQLKNQLELAQKNGYVFVATTPSTPAKTRPAENPEGGTTEKGTIVTGPNGEKTWVSGNDLPTGWESGNPVYTREISDTDTNGEIRDPSGKIVGTINDGTSTIVPEPVGTNYVSMGKNSVRSDTNQGSVSYYKDENGKWRIQAGEGAEDSDKVLDNPQLAKKLQEALDSKVGFIFVPTLPAENPALANTPLKKIGDNCEKNEECESGYCDQNLDPKECANVPLNNLLDVYNMLKEFWPDYSIQDFVNEIMGETTTVQDKINEIVPPASSSNPIKINGRDSAYPYGPEGAEPSSDFIDANSKQDIVGNSKYHLGVGKYDNKPATTYLDENNNILGYMQNLKYYRNKKVNPTSGDLENPSQLMKNGDDCTSNTDCDSGYCDKTVIPWVCAKRDSIQYGDCNPKTDMENINLCRYCNINTNQWTDWCAEQEQMCGNDGTGNCYACKDKTGKLYQEYYFDPYDCNRCQADGTWNYECSENQECDPNGKGSGCLDVLPPPSERECDPENPDEMEDLAACELCVYDDLMVPGILRKAHWQPQCDLSTQYCDGDGHCLPLSQEEIDAKRVDANSAAEDLIGCQDGADYYNIGQEYWEPCPDGINNYVWGTCTGNNEWNSADNWISYTTYCEDISSIDTTTWTNQDCVDVYGAGYAFDSSSNTCYYSYECTPGESDWVDCGDGSTYYLANCDSSGTWNYDDYYNSCEYTG